ncbi:hypothetical protein HS088_TW09G00499 [Tripterygium wilfordii]|uniref:Uncharacterized protein n=1 Tax=Tripterygium wilfordii TaxID=458696 RepID=A0A7J7D808_TRIWF|nr:hypothetical protein HS088_TW09G00499 [Tripterygium wilfordii]
MKMLFKIIRGTLRYWVAYMRPISCPFNDFVLPPENSWKLQPFGARNRSSFNIANAFASSRNPSSSVHKPISCKVKVRLIQSIHSLISKKSKLHSIIKRSMRSA